MLLPRALAIRREPTGSSASDQAVVLVDGTDHRDPQLATQSPLASKNLICLSSTFQSINAQHAPPKSGAEEVLSSVQIETNYAFDWQTTPQVRAEHSYTPGCIVWLTGLPDSKLNKVHILKLVDSVIHFQPGGAPDIEVDAQQSDLPSTSLNQLVKYIEFTKGLSNCHIRFSNPLLVDRFIKALELIKTGTNKSLIIKITNKIRINCKQLDATTIEGRREEIFWSKIPKHLHL
ncbi:hypothetical protein O181_093728 [Austropuccinia psidii MF-1]|uniref:La-related protein 7 homolog xRRM domain-containing protein n=1 Tax=Austropuccinia psidii MF-1 TaxID=1389203 RepID=A0A9Q3P9L1_9BASI|nr:hypothetical protein [Austropuccinia psidii MF-1]